MSRLNAWLMLGFIACIGCGKRVPTEPKSEAQEAARVFAVAQDLENRQKIKEAVDAYQQVVRYFPKTPEAKKAADRIAKAQRDATQRAAAAARKKK